MNNVVESVSYEVTSKFHLLSQVLKQYENHTKHFFLHSRNIETYCQCCEFLHSCSFYSLLFPVKQYKLNAVRITSDSPTKRAFGNVPN